MSTQTSFFKHARLLIGKVAEGFSFARDMLIGTGITLATLLIQVALRLSTIEDWKQHRAELILSLIAPYVAVLAIHFLWRAIIAPWKVYQDQEQLHGRALRDAHDQLDSLQKQLAAANQIAPNTLTRDWPGDWKHVEDGFRKLANARGIRADWFRDSGADFEQWRVCGGSTHNNRECEALCMQAGRLLTISPISAQVAPQILAYCSDVDRWLYFLRNRYGLEDVMIGTSISREEQSTATAGSIHNLATTSATACIECAAKSFSAANTA